MPIRDFRDKGAVVTGAANGIGLAIARELLARGARVALADADPVIRKHAVAMKAEGARVSTHVIDVADRASMLALPEEVLMAHGRVQLVVNAASVSIEGPFEELALADLDRTLGVNFWGVVHGCRAFLPVLRREPEAHIVNVSSSFAWLGMAGTSAYAASKAAVRALSESLRAELAPIGVTLLFPGPVSADSARRNATRAQRAEQARPLAGEDPAAERVARRCLAGVLRNSSRVVAATDAPFLEALVRPSSGGAPTPTKRVKRPV